LTLLGLPDLIRVRCFAELNLLGRGRDKQASREMRIPARPHFAL